MSSGLPAVGSHSKVLLRAEERPQICWKSCKPGQELNLMPVKASGANGLRAVAVSGGTGCCHLPAQLLSWLGVPEHTDLGTGLESGKWIFA